MHRTYLGTCWTDKLIRPVGCAGPARSIGRILSVQAGRLRGGEGRRGYSTVGIFRRKDGATEEEQEEGEDTVLYSSGASYKESR